MTPRPPIQLIIDAICDAAGVSRAALVTDYRACYARIALVQLLMDYRGMSHSEAAEFTNYRRNGFTSRRITAAHERTRAIVSEAKWIIEQRHRPRGKNIFVVWPRTGKNFLTIPARSEP